MSKKIAGRKIQRRKRNT